MLIVSAYPYPPRMDLDGCSGVILSAHRVDSWAEVSAAPDTMSQEARMWCDVNVITLFPRPEIRNQLSQVS